MGDIEEIESSCTLESENDMGSVVFVGNLVLVLAILLGIFLVHVMVVSAVEAYWLSKVRRSVGRSTRRLS